MECNSIDVTRHAYERMKERRISFKEVHTTVRTGVVVREYPDDEPYPCYIVLGQSNGRPIHVVVAREPKAARCIVVTVYEPDPLIWETNLKTRRKP